MACRNWRLTRMGKDFLPRKHQEGLTMEYEFSLKFKLPASQSKTDEVIELLGAQNCTDAMVGLGQPGYLGLDFIRESASAKEAVLSAIKDVQTAISHIELVEASPDYVGLSDVAEIVGQTRQNLRKIMIGHHQQFPAPVHSGNPSLWHLAEVLDFLKSRQVLVSATVYEVAQATMQINLACQQPLIDPDFAVRVFAKV